MINLSRLFAYLMRSGRKGGADSSSGWGVLCAVLAFVLQLAASGATLVHRYSFTSSANDLMGTANGTLHVLATISGGKLARNGTGHAASLVSLPGRLASTGFADNAVTNGMCYYHVVTGLNSFGEESGYPAETFVTPTAASPTSLQFMPVPANTLQLSWWTDHTGGWLQTQSNLPSAGLRTNWVTVTGSGAATVLTVTFDPAEGSVFFRLLRP